MYGTTIRSYNENKDNKFKKAKKDKAFYNLNENKKNSKKLTKKEQDTKYMKLGTPNSANNEREENMQASEGFSIKELPIASVIITVILTMMMLVMTSGFGGL